MRARPRFRHCTTTKRGEPDLSGLLERMCRTSQRSRFHLLPRYEIVTGIHHPIRTRRADLHLVSGELVKEIRGSPNVDQFTIRIHPVPVSTKEIDVLRVFTLQCAGDFRVRADRVLAKG